MPRTNKPLSSSPDLHVVYKDLVKGVPCVYQRSARDSLRVNCLTLLPPGRSGSNFKGTYCESALRGMPKNLTNKKSTLVQVMDWCHQETSHFLIQCWPRALLTYGITRPQWVNTLQTKFFFQEHENMFAFFSIFSTLRLFREWKSSLLEDKGSVILHSQWHGCWWPDNARTQGISSHGIIHIILQHSGLQHQKG